MYIWESTFHSGYWVSTLFTPILFHHHINQLPTVDFELQTEDLKVNISTKPFLNDAKKIIWNYTEKNLNFNNVLNWNEKGPFMMLDSWSILTAGKCEKYSIYKGIQIR